MEMGADPLGSAGETCRKRLPQGCEPESGLPPPGVQVRLASARGVHVERGSLMNDLDRFQGIQRLLVTAGFSSKLDVRREDDYAVIKLTAAVGKPDPEVTQTLVEITTANDAAFTVEHDQAEITLLHPSTVD